jgi:hypothetical protein
MAKYTVTGYCFTHAGELNKEATSLAAAEALADKMKETILRDLRVPYEGSAMVCISKVVGKKSENIKRDRIEWPLQYLS